MTFRYPASIDWTNPNDKISQYFTVREALWLPQWNRLTTEADGLTKEIKWNIMEAALLMDIVRAALETPVVVHCWYRPTAYNKLVGGASKSAHTEGKAIDFSITTNDCDYVRDKILKLNLLETYELRMEDLPGSNWVHLDTRAPGPSGKRFFKP